MPAGILKKLALVLAFLVAPCGADRDLAPFLPAPALVEAAFSEEAEQLGFDELYSAATSRGVTLSDKLKAAEGKKVAMVGFMAPPLTPTINFFVLTREPVSICPFCDSDADWPVDIVVVKLTEPVRALPFDSPIKVTGILELGTEVDTETGFVSLLRIRSQKLEAL